MNQTPQDSPEQLKFKAQDLKENGHSIREIARILNTSKSTVDRWIKTSDNARDHITVNKTPNIYFIFSNFLKGIYNRTYIA